MTTPDTPDNAATPPLVAIVTGVGALIGQGIIRSLRSAVPGVRIVGVDRSADSPGPDWCDTFHPKPVVDERDPAYLSFWLELIDTTQARVVFPGIDIDTWFLSDHRTAFTASTSLVLNSPSLITVCRDKWALYEATRELPIDVIPTSLASDSSHVVARFAPPYVIKNRYGSGSRGMEIVPERDAVTACLSRLRVEDHVIQPFIGTDDEEYTAAAFGFGDGTSGRAIVFRRRLSPTGSTAAAVVVTEPAIEAAVVVLTQALRPTGPTNYQFRRDGSAFRLLEINPRFSSSSSIRTLFGYNEAAMAIEFYLSGRRPADPSIRNGRAWRYLADHVSYDRDSR